MKSFRSLKVFKNPKIGGLLYSEILQKTHSSENPTSEGPHDPMLGRYTILSY
jgi:hypothetical protein